MKIIENWRPEIGKLCEHFGRPIFQGRSLYTQITTVNMYSLIEKRHDILIQCDENESVVFENDILRNYSQVFLGCPKE